MLRRKLYKPAVSLSGRLDPTLLHGEGIVSSECVSMIAERHSQLTFVGDYHAAERPFTEDRTQLVSCSHRGCLIYHERLELVCWHRPWGG